MGQGRGYERRGDAFTRAVLRGEGPPTVISWERRSTGRRYFTRVPVHRCHTLSARDVAGAVRETRERLPDLRGLGVAQLAGVLVLDWNPQARQVRVNLTERPRELRAEMRVALDVTGTGVGAKGARVWLRCPRCGRRCGAVYGSSWGRDGSRLAQPVTGCRVCLGLTDESRQTHKTLPWVGAVDSTRPFSPDRLGYYRARSPMTRFRAHGVMLASMKRAFPGLFADVFGQR